MAQDAAECYVNKVHKITQDAAICYWAIHLISRAVLLILAEKYVYIQRRVFKKNQNLKSATITQNAAISNF